MDSHPQSIRAGGRMNKGGRDRDKVSPHSCPKVSDVTLSSSVEWSDRVIENDDIPVDCEMRCESNISREKFLRDFGASLMMSN